MPDNTEQQRKVTADAVVSIEQRVTMHRYAIGDAREASSC
jgi:hypothetical protein